MKYRYKYNIYIYIYIYHVCIYTWTITLASLSLKNCKISPFYLSPICHAPILHEILPSWSKNVGCVWLYVKYFTSVKYFSGENILRKGKHFLLFDCVVEITQENYFLCLVSHVKNLFLENVNTSQPPLLRTSTTHHQPLKIQTRKRKKTATLASLPPKSTKKPPQQQQN